MGVAGGATRTALIQHQARRDNMADVAAKDGSQVSPSTHQSYSCVHSDVHGNNLSFFADSGDAGEPCCVVSWASVDPSSGWMDRVC